MCVITPDGDMRASFNETASEEDMMDISNSQSVIDFSFFTPINLDVQKPVPRQIISFY